MAMIRKQYRSGKPGYFLNFIHANDPEESIDEALKPYQATIAKSKNDRYLFNVKWHDEKLYTVFVLEWS